MNKSVFPTPSQGVTYIRLSVHLPAWIGWVILLLGFFVIIGWHAHWPYVIQLSPQMPPMKYNTALGFVLAGLSLVLLAKKYVRLPFICGCLIMSIGILTSLEHLTHRSFGIDQVFIHDYILTATSFPGRMSLLAASCFTFLGMAILLAGRQRTGPTLTAGLLASVAGLIGAVAMFGHVAGIEVATGWGADTHMALNTAFAFLLFGTGLFLHCWHASGYEHFKLLKWAPITASVTLMAMIGIVSAAGLTQLKNATTWRQHTYEVIESTQSFQDQFIGIQRNVRGYVTMGLNDLLGTYQHDTNAWNLQLGRLIQLTQDNPAQSPRLKAIAEAAKNVLAYDNEIISLYQKSGAEAVLKVDTTGRGRTATGRLLDDVKAFTDQEKTLLYTRAETEQSDYQRVKNLLLFGSTLSAALLILASLMTSHELTFRKRAEAELQETLAFQQAILNSSDYGIVSTELNGLVRTFNPAAEQILGYRADEIIGKKTPVLWRDPLEIAERAEKISRQLGRPVKPNFEAIASSVQINNRDEGEWTFVRKDGSRFTSLLIVTALTDATGNSTGYLGIFRDVTSKKQFEAERETLIMELRTALAEVKTLSGLIPICGWCKSVRSDQGFWQTVEQYVHTHTNASFSHGICPACQEKFKAEVVRSSRLQ